MYKLKCFFKNKTETVESHLSISFFLALKIQNVNNNNFKTVGYQTNVSISRFFHIQIQLQTIAETTFQKFELNTLYIIKKLIFVRISISTKLFIPEPFSWQLNLHIRPPTQAKCLKVRIKKFKNDYAEMEVEKYSWKGDLIFVIPVTYHTMNKKKLQFDPKVHKAINFLSRLK